MSQVVELEMQLDEVREQYKIIARSANSRAQQRKLEFLEHNLEALNSVQKQVRTSSTREAAPRLSMAPSSSTTLIAISSSSRTRRSRRRCPAPRRG